MADRKSWKKKSKLNLRFRVKENQNLAILFLDRQSIQLSETWASFILVASQAFIPVEFTIQYVPVLSASYHGKTLYLPHREENPRAGE